MLRKPQVILTSLIAGLLLALVYLGVGRLPQRLRYAVLWIFAKIVFSFWKSRRELIIHNLFLVKPGLINDPKDAAWINFKTLVHSYSTLLGTEKADLAEVRSRIVGAEALIKACSEGEIVAVFPHVGDLNALMSVLSALGLQAFIPAEGIHPILFKTLSGLRARHGNIEFSPVRKGKTKEVCIQKLAEGKIVGLAMDITTQPGKGVEFTIGNGTADFRVGAVEIAMRQKAAFFLVFPHWDGKKMSLAIEPFNLDYNLSVDENVRRILKEYSPYLQANVLHWWRLAFMEMRLAIESAQELGFTGR